MAAMPPTSRQQGPIAVYGATGYTGRLVTAELAGAGADLVIAGRNRRKLDTLAAETRGEVAVKEAALEDPSALRALLADCLKSALAQTCGDLEVVVVDNASTDGTWEVCREFAPVDSRVRIFRNPENIGPVRNWQRCFR